MWVFFKWRTSNLPLFFTDFLFGLFLASTSQTCFSLLSCWMLSVCNERLFLCGLLQLTHSSPFFHPPSEALSGSSYVNSTAASLSVFICLCIHAKDHPGDLVWVVEASTLEMKGHLAQIYCLSGRKGRRTLSYKSALCPATYPLLLVNVHTSSKHKALEDVIVTPSQRNGKEIVMCDSRISPSSCKSDIIRGNRQTASHIQYSLHLALSFRVINWEPTLKTQEDNNTLMIICFESCSFIVNIRM